MKVIVDVPTKHSSTVHDFGLLERTPSPLGVYTSHMPISDLALLPVSSVRQQTIFVLGGNLGGISSFPKQ